jgi:nucleotide-binding universal stress UspA family protein
MPAVAIRSILVPVDFSQSSRAALDYAAALAEQTKARIEVLYVHEPASYLGSASLVTMPQVPGPAWDETRREIVRELEAFFGATRSQVRNVRIEPGNPGDVIPDVAKTADVDLIVMGTHGRSGLNRLLVGSVAESVMRKATVPVLTLRMPKREARERVPL